MLQLTAKRVHGAEGFAPIMVVANAGHADEIEAELAEIGAPADLLVLEPVARNTAPAIAIAALLAPEEAPLLVMPSDHLILDTPAFLEAVAAALPAANAGWLVTFGVTPDRPETGYGYIKQGDAVAPGVRHADSFLEKPDALTAAAFLADGLHYWNAGIFLFRAGAYLDALERYAPDVLSAARTSILNADRAGARVAPEASAFAASPSISIDYAVMEQAEEVAVVPVSMGWSDIGSWDALHEMGEKDVFGNIVAGNALLIDGSNSLVRSDGPSVVAIGVEDLIVIASGDAVLIVPRGESQRVREGVEALKSRRSRPDGEGNFSG
jgi:mannose-1-phosphate guanylyltransferase/mannose-1-phosphate guanylyltransferase/mannose-6-phosphate isomerase